MTDKEKLNAIRAEVRNYIDAAHKAHTNITRGNLVHLLSFINTLQEEPVSEPQVEKLGELQHVNDTCKENGNSLTQEPISENFEEALASEWKGYVDRGAANVDALEDNTQELAFAKGFYRGVKWGINQAKVEIQAQSMALAHGCPKEHISEELEEAAKNVGQKYFPNEDNIWARPNYEAVKAECAFKDGANWQKEKFEKNRLAHCDAQTEEEAQRESNFVMGIITKEHRQPTFNDAIKYGMKIQKEQMMAKAFPAEIDSSRCDGRCILGGNFARFETGERVKVIAIKED